MDLIDDDQLPGLRAQERIRIGEPPPIERPLEVEIERSAFPLNGDSLRQGGLSDLTRPEQHDARQATKLLFYDWAQPACDHWNTGKRTSNVNIPVLPCQCRARSPRGQVDVLMESRPRTTASYDVPHQGRLPRLTR